MQINNIASRNEYFYSILNAELSKLSALYDSKLKVAKEYSEDQFPCLLIYLGTEPSKPETLDTFTRSCNFTIHYFKRTQNSGDIDLYRIEAHDWIDRLELCLRGITNYTYVHTISNNPIYNLNVSDITITNTDKFYPTKQQLIMGIQLQGQINYIQSYY